MDASTRRNAVLQALTAAESPISASQLAAQFSVSRQIIVGDVALLRAAGEAISATPRGYVLDRARQGITCTVACRHPIEGTEQPAEA
jgi:transcriptional regulator of NAD metabolism